MMLIVLLIIFFSLICFLLFAFFSYKKTSEEKLALLHYLSLHNASVKFIISMVLVIVTVAISAQVGVVPHTRLNNFDVAVFTECVYSEKDIIPVENFAIYQHSVLGTQLFLSLSLMTTVQCFSKSLAYHHAISELSSETADSELSDLLNNMDECLSQFRQFVDYLSSTNLFYSSSTQAKDVLDSCVDSIVSLIQDCIAYIEDLKSVALAKQAGDEATVSSLIENMAVDEEVVTLKWQNHLKDFQLSSYTFSHDFFPLAVGAELVMFFACIL